MTSSNDTGEVIGHTWLTCRLQLSMKPQMYNTNSRLVVSILGEIDGRSFSSVEPVNSLLNLAYGAAAILVLDPLKVFDASDSLQAG